MASEQQRLTENYRIKSDSIPFPEGSLIRSLDDAVSHLRAALDREPEFEASEVLESKDWWYIPYGWVGCAGFIVDKTDGYINQLGSNLPLDLCFWAHSRNIKYAYADLTVLQINAIEPTIATLMKMGNRAPLNPIPNKSDADGNRTKFFTKSDIANQLDLLPATFENQHLWFTIRALKQSADAGDFVFAVEPGSWVQTTP